MERSFWFRLTLIVVSLSGTVYLIDALRRFWAFLGSLLLAIFFAWLVGSILLHIVSNLMRIPRMRRSWAILVVYLALITLVADFLFLVVPATVNQVLDIAQLLPTYVNQLPTLTAKLQNFLAGFGLQVQILNQLQIDSLNQLAGTITDWVTRHSIEIFQSAFSALFLTGLVIVLSFYFVLDGGRRLNEALKVLPPGAEREARFVLHTIDETFYGYVRGILVISMVYGVATSGILLATGLPAALPTGIISAVLLAVPFVGDWLALVLPVLIALLSGHFVNVIIVLAFLLFVQQVMLHLLNPRILGHAVHMPAMIVVVAVVLGERLAGVPGALLGVPSAAVIYTLSVHYGMRIRHAREAREAAAMAAAGVMPAPEATPSTTPQWRRDAEPNARRMAQSQPVLRTDPEVAEDDQPEGINFQDQLRKALGEIDDPPTLPRQGRRRIEESS